MRRERFVCDDERRIGYSIALYWLLQVADTLGEWAAPAAARVLGLLRLRAFWQLEALYQVSCAYLCALAVAYAPQYTAYSHVDDGAAAAIHNNDQIALEQLKFCTLCCSTYCI